MNGELPAAIHAGLRDTPHVTHLLTKAEQAELSTALDDWRSNDSAIAAAGYATRRPSVVLQPVATKVCAMEGKPNPTPITLTAEEAMALFWYLNTLHNASWLQERISSGLVETNRLPTTRGPNWDDIRSRELERAEYECERCGTSDSEERERTGAGLHVHHRIPYQRFQTADLANVSENLMVLCGACHQTVESETTARDQTSLAEF